MMQLLTNSKVKTMLIRRIKKKIIQSLLKKNKKQLLIKIMTLVHKSQQDKSLIRNFYLLKKLNFKTRRKMIRSLKIKKMIE
jgi:hypothetical protein